MSKNKKKLGEGELDVMLALWQGDLPMTGGEILQRLGEKRSWGISTLMTVLARLADKGFVTCDRTSGTNLYAALVAEEDYKEQESRSFLTRLYSGSLPGLVSCLYNGGAIDQKDLEELRRFLDKTTGEV